jgi:predicted molibdopterin-dependent oxidoreductase YjgC
MGATPGWFPGYRETTDAETIEALEKEWCASLRDMAPGDADVARLLADKKIKVAVVFGEDPLGTDDLPAPIREGLLAVDFLVVADIFLTRTAAAANVVLPLSSPAETSGTFTNSERRVQPVRRAIPPRSGYESWEVISQLAARMGLRFKMKYDSTAQVMEEIRRVAPIYRDVVIGSQDGDSIWDASRSSLATARVNGTAMAPAVTPVRTAGLDVLDARFDAWFAGLFARKSEVRSLKSEVRSPKSEV